jgi:exodeoxyribonuclease VII small subunit
LAESQQSEEQPPSFEESLAELESLVERLESGEGSLEQALADFERGIHLARQCEARLTEAEQTVQQLVGEGEAAELAPFTAGDEDGTEGAGEDREGGE